MSSLWPTITTGILGILAGFLVGRRQITDQAAVEHRQWLRGQRQEAYINLLDAWDTAIAALEHVVDVWEEREDFTRRHGEGNMWETVGGEVAAANQTLAKPIDRAALMGPPAVDAAVAAMDAAFDNLSAYLNHQADPDEPFEADWHTWASLLTAAHRARYQFMDAAKLSLRMMPRPGARPWNQPWWRPVWRDRGQA